MAMDVDGAGGCAAAAEESPYGCDACKRLVCDMCAVVVVGVGRDCLQCKTSRKALVGGLGWM